MIESYPQYMERLVKSNILERIQNAVRDAIEVGVTPNWILLGPSLAEVINPNITKISGMKIWRSHRLLPENKEVIAIRCLDSKVNNNE